MPTPAHSLRGIQRTRRPWWSCSGILFPRVWVWCLGVAWAILMAISRTYLGAHWISDTIGGLLLGAGVAIIVWTPLAHRLAIEATQPHPFFLVRSRQ